RSEHRFPARAASPRYLRPSFQGPRRNCVHSGIAAVPQHRIPGAFPLYSHTARFQRRILRTSRAGANHRHHLLLRSVGPKILLHDRPRSRHLSRHCVRSKTGKEFSSLWPFFVISLMGSSTFVSISATGPKVPLPVSPKSFCRTSPSTSLSTGTGTTKAPTWPSKSWSSPMNGWRWNEKRCGSHWVRGEPVYFPSHYRRFSSSRSFARAFRSFATRFSPLVLPRNAPITSAGRVTTW